MHDRKEYKKAYYLENIERIKSYRDNYNAHRIIFKSFMKDGFRYKKCCSCKVILEESAFSKNPDSKNKIWKREKNCIRCLHLDGDKHLDIV